MFDIVINGFFRGPGYKRITTSIMIFRITCHCRCNKNDIVHVYLYIFPSITSHICANTLQYKQGNHPGLGSVNMFFKRLKCVLNQSLKFKTSRFEKWSCSLRQTQMYRLGPENLEIRYVNIFYSLLSFKVRR